MVQSEGPQGRPAARRCPSAARISTGDAGADAPAQSKGGGAEGDRTPDLVIANDALSHLSYGPTRLPDIGKGASNSAMKIAPQAASRAAADYCGVFVTG